MAMTFFFSSSSRVEENSFPGPPPTWTIYSNSGKKKKTFITRTVMIKSFNLFWFCIELELTLTTSCVNGKVICLSTVSQNWIENLVNAAHYSYELLNFRFVLCDVSSLIEFPVYIINSRPMMRWWQICRLIVLLGIDLQKTLLLAFFSLWLWIVFWSTLVWCLWFMTFSVILWGKQNP